MFPLCCGVGVLGKRATARLGEGRRDRGGELGVNNAWNQKRGGSDVPILGTSHILLLIAAGIVV